MRAHGLTACDCLWFIFCVNLYFWFIFSPSPQIWGVGGRFLAQASIQILELIYECNFQMDTNAAPLRLASAQNMNTAENYRNNSSKGRKSIQDTACPSAAWRCLLWLIECQPACWYLDNNMFSEPSILLTGHPLPMSYYLAGPGGCTGVDVLCTCCCCLSTQSPDQIVSGTKTFRIYSLRSWLDILYKSRSLRSLVCRIIPALIIPRSRDSGIICDSVYCDHEKCVQLGYGLRIVKKTKYFRGNTLYNNLGTTGARFAPGADWQFE